MDGWKTRGKRLITAEDGCHDSQQSTESSYSISSTVMLSASLSTHSYQEASKEAYSFRNHGGSTDSSISNSFSGRLKEPVTASSESGVTAEIACKAIRNTRAKNSMNIRSYHEHGDHPTSHSGERMISSALSEESQNILAAKCEQVEMGPEVLDKIKDDFLGNESFESSTVRPSKVAAKDQDMFISQFDLNEDINENGTDNLIQPVDATKSSHAVIHVLAKAGKPRGLPTAPLEFEGGLGWKGSAETSAFRPAALSKILDGKTSSRNYSRINDPQGFTGIDLNVPAVEDSAANGLPTEREGISSASTLQCFHSEVGLKRADTLGIDLNCLYEASDEFIQSSPPCESKNPSLVDLNLNVNTSIEDASNIVPWLEQGCQSSVNKTSDLANPGKQDSNITRNACLADFNMQQVPAHARRYLVAAPNILQPIELMQRAALSQPRLPYIPHRLPPHSYPPKLPVYFGTTNPLPSYIHNSCTTPYAIYPHEHGIFPDPSTVHSTIGASQLAQLAHGHSTSNFTSSTPKVDDYLLSGSKIDEVRRSKFLAEDSPMDEHIKSLNQSCYATTSMKRKEPEGGIDYYQLGYRQAT